MRTKISVSEIKHRNMILEPGDEEALAWYAKEETADSYVPLFVRTGQEAQAGAEEMLTSERPDAVPGKSELPGQAAGAGGNEIHPGALRGTAMHRFMECIDYGALAGNKAFTEVARQLEKLKSQGRIGSEATALIDTKRVWRFLQSDLAERIIQAHNSGSLYREQPFVMGLPAREADPKIDSGELVLVQGIIDLYFEEDGELVLLDYKTDAVKEARELIARYQTQMDLYARALAAATGKKVRQKLIYSFRLGELIEV